jgi:RNA polymerase sigma-70 factor (ECF subfamily)
MSLVQDGVPARYETVRELTSAIARGNAEAFNLFYEQYSPRVYRLLWVITRGDESLSRELHQIVMIKAARKLKALPSEAALWAWLAQVARNGFRDILRKRKREEIAMAALPIIALSTGSRTADSESLDAAIAALDSEERRLIELFYFEDIAQAEMAGRSGRTVKAIQCELARIRKKLKETLSRFSTRENE